MTKYAIDIKGLNKTYKASGKSAEKIALRDVDLKIPKGSIFALLGPNGAGKSTMINIMAGLVRKSAGTVKIWNSDIDADARNAKASIGIVPQEINFDPFFTPAQLLNLQAGMYGVPKAERRTMELLETVTVLLTTHYLEEAEELCDQIAIIHNGQIIANEDKETLLGRISNKEIRFRMDRPFKDIPQALSGVCAHAQKEGRRTLMLRYSPDEVDLGAVLTIIQKAKLGIADITTDDSDLEDVFLQLTSSK